MMSFNIYNKGLGHGRIGVHRLNPGGYTGPNRINDLWDACFVKF
jgi:hypothetical protein